MPSYTQKTSDFNDHVFNQLPQEFQYDHPPFSFEGYMAPYYLTCDTYASSPGSAVSSDSSSTSHVTEFYSQDQQLVRSLWPSKDVPAADAVVQSSEHIFYPVEPLPLHAPIPHSPYARMLTCPERRISGTYSTNSRTDAEISSTTSPHQLSLPSLPVIAPADTTLSSPGDYYSSLPLVTFPTPSELLNDLAVRDERAAAVTAHVDSDTALVNPTFRSRRSRGRIIAQHIGFRPTDPDHISSHDKKRLYLESLEQYVMYLHDQLRIIGTEPIPLERVSTYRGLSSRSIRTLLVHMEAEVRKMHSQTIAEEQEFLDLRDEYLEYETPFLASQGSSHHLSGNPNDVTNGMLSRYQSFA